MGSIGCIILVLSRALILQFYRGRPGSARGFSVGKSLLKLVVTRLCYNILTMNSVQFGDTVGISDVVN